MLHVDNEECSPLLAEYFRTKKMLDDVVEEEKPSQLIFEITSNDGFCVRARSCDGKAVLIFHSQCVSYDKIYVKVILRQSLKSYLRYDLIYKKILQLS